ncbi:MAG: DUF4281 domain-containing protein [Myxococcaceae bacterium]|nr:DUF4281 domain-containing protein [Myxococcaceae bacterium]
MTPELVFGLANPFATLGWLALVALPGRPFAQRAALAVVAVLAALYLVVLGSQLGSAQGGFGSLEQLALLFHEPWVLLAGWVHYLAFDLFIGAWEARDARRHGVPHWALVPCLALTFLVGPVGLLTWLGVRAVAGRPQPA